MPLRMPLRMQFCVKNASFLPITTSRKVGGKSTGELGMVEKGRGAHDTRAVATGGTTDSPIRIAACVHS